MPEKPAKSALILLSSEGTEEIEFVTIYDGMSMQRRS